jgi:7,8-dihydropterin-6-yl-methyl-4-(beta-D-ribofuranosyl)aminobenzene 5'-phosphate synthase
MSWKLTILVNNYTKRSELLAEHGLALLLHRTGESGSHPAYSLLLDTGQRYEVLAANAEVLGIDLERVDAIALSHGHYDHTGGLRKVLGNSTHTVDLYAHLEAFAPKFSEKGKKHPIGSPVSLAELEELPVRLTEVTGPLELTAGLILTGTVPRIHDFEEEARRWMYTEKDGVYGPDLLPDDQSVVLVKPGVGFYLICGCCHSGLLNTLDYARSISGEERLLGVIGGLHTVDAGEERLRHTVSRLREWAPPFMIPLHCAGAKETAILYREIGEGVRFLSVGDTVEL